MPIVALGLTLRHNMVMPEGVEVVGFFFYKKNNMHFTRMIFLESFLSRMRVECNIFKKYAMKNFPQKCGVH